MTDESNLMTEEPNYRFPVRVTSRRWPGMVEINSVRFHKTYVEVFGTVLETGASVSDILSRDEFEELVRAETKTDFSADPKDYFLALEALRYRLASLYDPLLAMNISKVDPLPHQIEAVYGYVLKLPRIRFLIADDPGAGKTIMAGLVIKELKLRGLAKRILIVVPGHLKDQWLREMQDRFEENFIIIDRGIMDNHYGENPWQRENQIITSMDFAKQDDVWPSLCAAHYDLVIVDEAHKMAAYRYGDKVYKTARYRLGERLSQSCTHMLFLTATPHRGDPESFRLFLDLLEPGFFATETMIAESIQNKDNPLFIRRLKEDLRDFDGKPLFLPRHVKTIEFNLGIESPYEKELYNDLSRYVSEQFSRVQESDKHRNVAFALVILQRRLASSTYALLRSLERRKKRLQENLNNPERMDKKDALVDLDTLDEVEDLSEEERWEQEQKWETVSLAANRQELQEEIRVVESLMNRAKTIVDADPPVEAKLKHLKEALDDLNRDYPGEKIIVFTESRDTLEYLEKKLRGWGYSVCSIHGGMNLQDRIDAERIFKNEAQVMVATEAAGEGINLQFCHLMINYDIPWNPNRLEQRMGRIHRYGQTREVFIFNLVANDTREGKVLQALFNKLQQIRDALGSDKVFDVLGEMKLPGKNLNKILIDAAASARSLDEILREIDIQIDEEYLNRVRAELGESLATHFIDYTRIRDMAKKAHEHRLIPEYTEAFFRLGIEKLGGALAPRRVAQFSEGQFFSLDRVPEPLRRISMEEDFRRRFGQLRSSYSLITFDKELSMRHSDAELVTFGNPLFEALMLWVERNLQKELTKGTVFVDPDGRMDGTLFFYQGEVHDGKHEIVGRRLFALLADRKTGSVTPVNPAILWDLEKDNTNRRPPAVPLDELKGHASEQLIPEIESYRQSLLEERQRQANIKRKYGVESLNYLIRKEDNNLIELHRRQSGGENVDVVIHNAKERKLHYQHILKELEETLERELSLTVATPRFLGAARVVPSNKVVDEMVSDPEIEKIAMEIAMEYERMNGRHPEDVSLENLGYDLRSADDYGNLRYIEVKGRAASGPVALTQNEWFMAQRFGDAYYLYVVLDAASRPQLYRIQNPWRVLRPAEQVDVRYWVTLEQITEKGERS